MNYKEITDLVKLLNKSELTEFRLKDKEFELQIRTKYFQGKSSPSAAPAVVHVPTPAAAPAATAPVVKAPVVESKPKEEEKSTANLLEVKSPIVGTFYRSSSPDKGPFVKVGDEIGKGSVVCIVEAMKLFNEIESEVAGKIVKVLVEDAQPVEYDQVLFLVDPS